MIAAMTIHKARASIVAFGVVLLTDVAGLAQPKGVTVPTELKTHNKWTDVVAAAALVWAICACSAVMNAQTPAPSAASGIWSGVYTNAQAKRGETTANRTCLSCHGPGFTGDEAGPALVGLEFLGNWNAQSLGDLFDRIHSTMPGNAPGSLSLQDTADVIARVLQLNNFPTGEKELPTDMNALNQIKIEAQPPAK
jgi:S-disulfanyl-L-cysteine oxidoreductase SoxD